jgi:hypothetical protein
VVSGHGQKGDGAGYCLKTSFYDKERFSKIGRLFEPRLHSA